MTENSIVFASVESSTATTSIFEYSLYNMLLCGSFFTALINACFKYQGHWRSNNIGLLVAESETVVREKFTEHSES